MSRKDPSAAIATNTATAPTLTDWRPQIPACSGYRAARLHYGPDHQRERRLVNELNCGTTTGPRRRPPAGCGPNHNRDRVQRAEGGNAPVLAEKRRRDEAAVVAARLTSSSLPTSRRATGASQRQARTKNPALVVFRLCFGTSLEHLGQAGCFRLPVKACRQQPPLCVPESFSLWFKCLSRWPRTGQGKFRLRLGKEHAVFAAASVPVSAMKTLGSSKKPRSGFRGRESVRQRHSCNSGFFNASGRVSVCPNQAPTGRSGLASTRSQGQSKKPA